MFMSAFFMFIGLTGNIATGKSAAFRIFCALRNAIRFDADAEVHALYRTEIVKKQLVSNFGTEVIDENGDVDRELIRRLFLTDSSVRPYLEGLFHPLVYERYEKKCQQLKQGEVLVADIPLLFEKDSNYRFDYVVTVACSSDIQLKRLISRSGLDKHTAMEMIKKQVALSYKISQSDFVLWNNGSLDQLQSQLNTLVHHIFNECR